MNKKAIRRFYLKSASDVRRMLSGLVHELKSGEIDPVVGSKIIYASAVLLRAIEVADLESRLRELENVIEKSN
ncbi:MAG: hypothetical protein C4522_08710 [Desulfobacteraceae bacterium]|nr:MAG: hypothetical protein C4522_08710 [Desulfobacteraceae bacterium]